MNGLTHPGLSIFHNKYPDNFDDIILMRAFIGNYSRGICLSEHNQQLSFKYFINSFLDPIVFSNVVDPNDTFQGDI